MTDDLQEQMRLWNRFDTQMMDDLQEQMRLWSRFSALQLEIVMTCLMVVTMT